MGNEFGDEVAKETAALLKKKEDPTLGSNGDSESASVPGSSELQGAEAAQPQAAELPELPELETPELPDPQAPEAPTQEEGELPQGETPAVPVPEGQAEDAYTSDDAQEELLPETFPELVEFLSIEENQERYPELHENLLLFFKRQEKLAQAETMADLEDIFAESDMEDVIDYYSEFHPYQLAKIRANTEFRLNNDLPEKGNLNDYRTRIDEGIAAANVQLYALDKEIKDGKNLTRDMKTALKLQFQQTREFVRDGYKKLEELEEILGPMDPLQDLNISQSARNVYMSYTSAEQAVYAEELFKQARNVFLRSSISEAEANTKMMELAADLQAGNLTMTSAIAQLQEVEASYLTPGQPSAINLLENTELREKAQKAGHDAASKRLRTMVDLGYDGMGLQDEDGRQTSYQIREIERELYRNKLLAIDLDGDKLISPMDLSSSRLGALFVPLGAIDKLEDVFGPENVDLYFQNFRPVYELADRFATSLGNTYGDALGGVLNILTATDMMPEEVEVFNQLFQELFYESKEIAKRGQSLDVGEGAFGLEGELSRRGAFHSAADSSAYMAILRMASQVPHPVVKGAATALLFSSLANRTHEDLTRAELKNPDLYDYSEKSDRDKMIYLAAHSGSELLLEMAFNKAFGGYLRGLGSIGTRGVINYASDAAKVGFKSWLTEFSTELATYGIQNALDGKLVLTDKGIKVRGLDFDKILVDSVNLAKTTGVMSGSMTGGAVVADLSRRNSKVKELRKGIEQIVKDIDSGKLSGQDLEAAYMKLVVDSGQLSGLIVDLELYHDSLSKTDEGRATLARLQAVNEEIQSIKEQIENSPEGAEKDALASKLAVLLRNKYEIETIGFAEFHVESQDINNRLDYNIKRYTDKKIELESVLSALEDKKKDGQFVDEELAFAEQELKWVTGTLDSLVSTREEIKAQAATEEEEKEKDPAKNPIFTAQVLLGRSESKLRD